ncbi:hypothetical protein ARC20_01885 [Stenotrophomonas panacihumi]|uniref:O-antigen ligase-related domain-containing protein n=1 Tax=Stenotrophomonas panacihumi TaxID=676599 RepID=A0A0R0AAM7_9GAMM|nr:O-antigen ligase family protein [Stenotrophomonas panacihumi]KRG38433.1 hypothetical protein ARC20_01885 [Stenotrophomonas panacihumi]PTN54331.1 hypothetical protein C9J98_10845 [Stenotrophomonas panacihumi]
MRFSNIWVKWLLPVTLIQKKVLEFVPFYQGQILVSWYIAAEWVLMFLRRPRKALPGVVFWTVAFIFCFQQVLSIELRHRDAGLMDLVSACTGMLFPFLLFNMLFKIFSIKFSRDYEHTRDGMLRSVEISFYVLLPFMVLQGLAAYGFTPAGALNNLLAPIYEARWDPFATSKADVHFFYRQGSYATTEFRINGTFEETPNLMLAFATLYVPFALAALKYRRPGSGVMMLLVLLFLAVSKSSSGLLMLALALGWIWWIRKSWRVAINALAIGVLVLLPVVLGSIMGSDMYTKYVEKLANMDNTSTNTRSASIIVALGMIHEAPIWGWGRQLYHEGVEKYVPSFSYGNWEIQAYLDNGKFHIYNIPLLLMVEYGVPLTLLSFVVAFMWFSRRYRRVRAADPYMGDLSIYFFCFLLFSMTFMGTYFLFQYFIPLAFFSAAFLVLASRRFAERGEV